MEPAMSQPQRKLTVEDYEHFPENDGKRHELIDGEQVVTAAPFVPHQLLLRDLFVAVHEVVEERRLGMVLFAPVDVELSRHDVLQPDLLFVSKQRMHIVSRRRFHAAPDLAVEVLSASTRRLDELRKRARYEKFGVQELWIVDPPIDAIRVYRRAAETEPFGRVVQLTAAAGEALESPLLPGFSLSLSAFFAVTKDFPDDALEGS
ncbi:MAG TPA: Uma2 family endonuclease [Thermoanaerobaculia bacterium]|nr:Uma2 family endonuclease [Thermoanaerobaculia bacterium]